MPLFRVQFLATGSFSPEFSSFSCQNEQSVGDQMSLGIVLVTARHKFNHAKLWKIKSLLLILALYILRDLDIQQEQANICNMIKNNNMINSRIVRSDYNKQSQCCTNTLFDKEDTKLDFSWSKKDIGSLSFSNGTHFLRHELISERFLVEFLAFSFFGNISGGILMCRAEVGLRLLIKILIKKHMIFNKNIL